MTHKNNTPAFSPVFCAHSTHGKANTTVTNKSMLHVFYARGPPTVRLKRGQTRLQALKTQNWIKTMQKPSFITLFCSEHFY